MIQCFHCGDDCLQETIVHQEKSFCCHGCKTVYDILNDNDLMFYYDIEDRPGNSPKFSVNKFDYLDNAEIAEKLIDFSDGTTQIISFLIPKIHCSSCIWVLENLSKLQSAIKSSTVNFPEKTVQISFNAEAISLKELVLLLSQIGYEPNISLENYSKTEKKIDRSLIYKLGVAGFAFGNVMFLSFPEYFEVAEFWLDQFKPLFRWLMFAFSVPVLLYSAQDYFISAYKGLRSKMLNIDVPIAIGILTLFVRSVIDISFDLGTGFFDSLTGLVFFLLMGRFFQQKTYSYLSFERDYKSYFPIAVTRTHKAGSSQVASEEQTQIYKVQKGDKILVRNEELIPTDALLLKGNALIDYSFVTGEAEAVLKSPGDKLYAGGRQCAGVIEIEVLKPVNQSYLTQLWSNKIFDKGGASIFQTLTDRISKKFTIAIISIAILATLFWLFYDQSKAFNVFTAVLIVACPCAIALSSPFTLGNLLRIFGVHKFYLKNTSVIEKMASIDTIVFDKTGTLTTHKKSTISYEGMVLSEEEESLLTSTLRASNHPLSRALYDFLDKSNIRTLDEFDEEIGKGISASIDNNQIKIGAYTFVNDQQHETKNEIAPAHNKTAVHLSTNTNYKGSFVFHNDYREGMTDVITALQTNKRIIVLSGDNDGEKEYLKTMLPKKVKLLFNQKPDDKLEYIKKLQKKGRNVMMIGDGLNDAGALAQSNVGIVISEDVNVFSPASDGIIDAVKFRELPAFFELSKGGLSIIKWSLLLSLAYNLVGLAFAVTGHLKPVVAAILMPLSSISIVVFTTVMTQLISKKLHVKNKS